jgi:hypothetical protein
MDMEWWKSFFESGGVILLFLTFAFGAGFMLTSKQIGERQSVRLRKFDSDLTSAKSELAKQQERAAKAEGGIANAMQKAAEANKAAEDERLARVALEAKLAPRRVTGEQRAKFVRACTHANRNIDVVGMLGVADADDFAEDLARTIADCGYNIRLTKSMILMPTPKGLRMYVGRDRDADATAISNALVQSGIISTDVERHPAPVSDSLQLQVGPKPQ